MYGDSQILFCSLKNFGLRAGSQIQSWTLETVISCRFGSNLNMCSRSRSPWDSRSCSSVMNLGYSAKAEFSFFLGPDVCWNPEADRSFPPSSKYTSGSYETSLD